MNNNFNISVANIIWVIGLIFTAGIAYSQLTYLEREIEKIDTKYQEKIEVLHRRLEKKIQEINENTEKIHELELELAKNACH